MNNRCCENCHHGNRRYDMVRGRFDSVECLYPCSIHDESKRDIKKLARGKEHSPEYWCSDHKPAEVYASW